MNENKEYTDNNTNINNANTNSTNITNTSANNAVNPTATYASTLNGVIHSSRYSINAKHKDSLFRLVFNDKHDLLDLYNTLNDTDYTDIEDLDIYTIDDVIYMTYKNDISFVLGNILSLYEHQSSLNPNMPVRGLIYFARNYESYIAVNRLNIYGTVLQKLPLPQYIIFYNGNGNEPEQVTLKLSDAFPEIDGKVSCLECTATMLNINYGHNRQLLDNCSKLKEYSLFVHTVREMQKVYADLKDAIDAAIDECIENSILKDILIKHRGEVRNVILTQFDQEAYEKAVRAEATELGRKEGLEQGIAIGENTCIQNLIHMNLSKGKSPAQIADILGVTEEFIEQLKE